MNVSSRFLTPLRNETIGERVWMLTDDLVFYSAKYQGIFIAPRGFQHNLASIPQIAQSIIPKVGRYDKAAVIHDNGDKIVAYLRRKTEEENESLQDAMSARE